MRTCTPILEFWFGDDIADESTIESTINSTIDSTIAGRQAGLWWGKSAQTDAEIRDRFEAQVQAAGAGKLDEWKASPQGWLALILLLDQFPRNIYRDTHGMFRFDDKARALTLEGLESGIDQQLRLIERVFFYLPLEHAESPDDQARCVELMRGLVDAAPADQKKTFEGFVDYAEAHRKIVDRFGRFPHRNSVLGRDSSPEEVEFLKQPGSSF